MGKDHKNEKIFTEVARVIKDEKKFWLLDNKARIYKQLEKLNEIKINDFVKYHSSYLDHEGKKTNYRNIKKILDIYKGVFLEKSDDYQEDNEIAKKLISSDESMDGSARKISYILSQDKKMTNTQFRRFYHELLGYKNLEDEKLKNKLELFLAQLAYAKGRKVILNIFYEFLHNRITKVIEKPEYFKYCLMHLQAVLGWFTFYKPKDN